MGVVYLARDERLGRQVALKVIAPDLAHDPEFQERFETEARSAAAIEHPNAVPIYSAGNVDGNLYIAMRYVEGTDLRKYLAEHGPLSPSEAATVVSEVAAALDAAHAAGFVHRDVKPANILLTDRPGRGAVFLTDFGLTRGVGAQTQLTGTGQWIGTLDYVAPEQMAAGRVDARTDIYSLGCVLYEMLAGTVPYTGDEMQKLWRKANEGPPPLERGDHAFGDHAFDPVLARALARDPEWRYRSAGDLGRAASAAAGARVEAPTERSVATGVAAAGLVEAATPPRPFRATPYDRPTIQMPRPEAPRRKRRSALAGTAIVICAIAVAAGLVTGALLLAGDSGGQSSTVVRKQPAAVTTTTSAGEEAEEAEATPEAADFEADEPKAAASASSAGGREPFFGTYYSVTVPSGWVQEEFEDWASDGSYIENTWNSPDGSEALKIDMSPGEPQDPTESAELIGEDLEAAGQTVYGINREVIRGGMLGTELVFRADSDPPQRSDFFFDLGDNGFAVLASSYDLRSAQSQIGPLVRSLELEG